VEDFLTAARSAATLLRDPAVTAAWNTPSALPEFSVAGLAGHLAYQIFAVQTVLSGPVPTEPTISLLEHYNRAKWIGADLDADINVGIRAGGDREAAEGPASLIARVDAAVAELTESLAVAENRPVRIYLWGPWSLLLNDFLSTRMMELVVHSDDLAVSIGLETPELPSSVIDTVVDLLSRLAVRRHGATAVLRALTRSERAPDRINAF
jgi:uncharacterized protein (TIGR03083 family)